MSHLHWWPGNWSAKIAKIGVRLDATARSASKPPSTTTRRKEKKRCQEEFPGPLQFFLTPFPPFFLWPAGRRCRAAESCAGADRSSRRRARRARAPGVGQRRSDDRPTRRELYDRSAPRLRRHGQRVRRHAGRAAARGGAEADATGHRLTVGAAPFPGQKRCQDDLFESLRGRFGLVRAVVPPQRAVPIESGHTKPRPPRTAPPIPIPSGFLP